MALAAGGIRPTFYSVEEALVRLSVERLADHATYNPEAGGGWQLCAGRNRVKCVNGLADELRKSEYSPNTEISVKVIRLHSKGSDL